MVKKLQGILCYLEANTEQKISYAENTAGSVKTGVVPEVHPPPVKQLNTCLGVRENRPSPKLLTLLGDSVHHGDASEPLLIAWQATQIILFVHAIAKP